MHYFKFLNVVTTVISKLHVTQYTNDLMKTVMLSMLQMVLY